MLGTGFGPKGDRVLHICRMLISCKKSYFRFRKSANFPKIYGPKISNPQIAIFAEGPQILKEVSVRKFAICGTHLRTARP
jgi:hypothetical protein